ncbi:hypothetical protein D3C79_450860 [compost metagenome]
MARRQVVVPLAMGRPKGLPFVKDHPLLHMTLGHDLAVLDHRERQRGSLLPVSAAGDVLAARTLPIAGQLLGLQRPPLPVVRHLAARSTEYVDIVLCSDPRDDWVQGAGHVGHDHQPSFNGGGGSGHGGCYRPLLPHHHGGLQVGAGVASQPGGVDKVHLGGHLWPLGHGLQHPEQPHHQSLVQLKGGITLARLAQLQIGVGGSGHGSLPSGLIAVERVGLGLGHGGGVDTDIGALVHLQHRDLQIRTAARQARIQVRHKGAVPV